MDKYVLFIPYGGLNDILTGIMNTIQYCKKYNRILLLSMKQSCYRIEFSDYFEIEDMEIPIIYHTNQIKDIITNKSIYNIDLDLIQLMNCHDITLMGIYWNKSINSFYRNIELILPDHPVKEDIILHVSYGGGYGYKMFKHLKFKNSLKEMIIDKTSRLKNYLCIQVRCTDHKCDYIDLYEKNKVLIHSYAQIYIATDQKDVVQFFRSKELPVFCFTTFPEGAYYNLHQSSMDKHTHFCDTLCDIFIASNSDQILSNSKGGFIRLLRDCHKNKEITLNQLK